MRTPVLASLILLAVVSVLPSPDLLAQTSQQRTAAPSTSAAPARDLSGVWSSWPGDPGLSPVGSLTGVGRGPGDMPPLTPWGQAKYNANKPGIRAQDEPGQQRSRPAVRPSGESRACCSAPRSKIATMRDRTRMFFGSAWRTIWTDGRALPDDPDPSWMGTSVGRWEGDRTFVVNSVGFDERTWLGQEGQPHSDEMRLEERWERVDQNTITLNATINDLKTYTTPFKTIQIVYKLRPPTYELKCFSLCLVGGECVLESHQEACRSATANAELEGAVASTTTATTMT